MTTSGDAGKRKFHPALERDLDAAREMATTRIEALEQASYDYERAPLGKRRGEAKSALEKARSDVREAFEAIAFQNAAVAALRAAEGYMLNAQIELGVGTKKTAIEILERGLKELRASLHGASHA